MRPIFAFVVHGIQASKERRFIEKHPASASLKCGLEAVGVGVKYHMAQTALRECGVFVRELLDCQNRTKLLSVDFWFHAVSPVVSPRLADVADYNVAQLGHQICG